MFAYIIIGIELIILYIGFWVIFIREPRPREIRAELWGNYYDSNGESVSSKPQIPEYLFIEQNKIESYLPSKAKIRSYRVARIRKRRHRAAYVASCSCMRSCHDVQHQTVNAFGRCGGRAEVLQREQLNRNAAEKFLLLLNRALNKISVKVP